MRTARREMDSEMKLTYESLKPPRLQQHRFKWSRAFQYLALSAVVVIGGAVLGCNADTSRSAAKSSGDTVPAVATNAKSAIDTSEGQVEWLTDYDKAIAQAKELGRPVLIDFAASWCAPCVMMDKHVWPKPTVLEALDSKVIPLRVDVDAKSTLPLVEKYKVEFLPTVLLIDAEGQELKREGFVDAEQVIEMIKSVM